MNTADVTIDRIAAGGDGIARSEGVVIFVPRTAPGDRARVRLDLRKRFARGTLEELLEAITLKRLGLYLNPIVLVNTRGFFAPLLTLLAHAVEGMLGVERGVLVG